MVEYSCFEEYPEYSSTGQDSLHRTSNVTYCSTSAMPELLDRTYFHTDPMTFVTIYSVRSQHMSHNKHVHARFVPSDVESLHRRFETEIFCVSRVSSYRYCVYILCAISQRRNKIEQHFEHCTSEGNRRVVRDRPLSATPPDQKSQPPFCRSHISSF